ncbi:hypothetical protein D3C87_1511610 [compost metagenome]
MLGARLYLRRDAEYARMLEAVGVLEVVESLVEHEVRFAFNACQAFFQASVESIQTLIERLEVALVACCVGRIGSAEVSSHFRGDDPGVDR